MNLVRAELGRLAARGFVRLMLAVLVLAFGITIATTLANSHLPTADEVAYAQQAADQSWIHNQEAHEACLASQSSHSSPEVGATPRQVCGGAPRRPELTQFMAGVFVFKYQIRNLTYFLITFLALFGFLVGASYIGAELTSGGMTNLLLWRPQRMVVLGAKLGSLLVAVLGVAVLGGALYVGAFRLIAEIAGLPGQLDAAFWGDLSLTSARGLGLVGMATAAGFGLAILGRHTSAALGVVAAYGVAWELGARVVMQIIQTARPDQWMFSTYLGIWMIGDNEFYDRQACVHASAHNCYPQYTITWLDALVVLVVLVGGLLAAAFASFHRRDLA